MPLSHWNTNLYVILTHFTWSVYIAPFLSYLYWHLHYYLGNCSGSVLRNMCQIKYYLWNAKFHLEQSLGRLLGCKPNGRQILLFMERLVEQAFHGTCSKSSTPCSTAGWAEKGYPPATCSQCSQHKLGPVDQQVSIKAPQSKLCICYAHVSHTVCTVADEFAEKLSRHLSHGNGCHFAPSGLSVH